MILDQISIIKNSSNKSIEQELKKIENINKIEKLLNQIDFNSETVPTNSFNRLNSLLTSLKGLELTTDETQIIKEICD